MRNLAFLPKLIRSTWQAVGLVRKLSPKVVVNVGGYASFPVTAAAMLRRVPIVVVSYDRRPGLVSKLVAQARRGVRRGVRGLDVAAGRVDRARRSARRSWRSTGTDDRQRRASRSSACPTTASCSPWSVVRWVPSG